MLKLKKLFFSLSILLAITLSASSFLNAQPKQINVLAPLKVGDPLNINSEKSQIGWLKFEKMLSTLKTAGVRGIEFDVWWGLVEDRGCSQYDWKYYDKMISLIEKYDLEPIPILSFHKLGESVDDGLSHIQMPTYATIDGEATLYLPFDNETGTASTTQINNQAVAPWGLKTLAPNFKNFMKAFRDHYGNHKTIQKIIISAGPCGELRYASYTEANGYPGPGRLMIYAAPNIQAFRDYAKEKFHNNINELNTAFGFSLNNFDQLYPPTGEHFFSDGYQYSEYGKFFFNFHHELLVEHGRKILKMGIDVYNLDPETPFKEGVTIGIKLAGLHWNFNKDIPNNYRLTEMFAGYVLPGQEDSNKGYEDILQMISEESHRSTKAGKPAVEVIYTAIEMSNHEEMSKGVLVKSQARTLTITMSELAKKYDVSISGENALPSFGDPLFWENLLGAVGDGYSEATLLRMNHFDQDAVGGITNLQKLTEFINKVNNAPQKSTPKSMQLISTLNQNIGKSTKEIESKYPDLFSKEVLSELVQKALMQEKRSDAVDDLGKVKKIVRDLNKEELNSLLDEVKTAEEELENQEKQLLLDRIATYGSQVLSGENEEKIIVGLVDYLITIQNGNINKYPKGDQLSVIIGGTLENEKRDSLYYWYNKIINSKIGEEEKVVLQTKLAVFSLLFLTNNTNVIYRDLHYDIVDFVVNVIGSGEITNSILTNAENGLKLPEYAIMDFNNKPIKVLPEVARDIINKIEYRLKGPDKLIK